jgi:hypothetical protein
MHCQGEEAFSPSRVGVEALITILPSSTGVSPTPSITISTIGLFIISIPLMYLCNLLPAMNSIAQIQLHIKKIRKKYRTGRETLAFSAGPHYNNR